MSTAVPIIAAVIGAGTAIYGADKLEDAQKKAEQRAARGAQANIQRASDHQRGLLQRQQIGKFNEEYKKIRDEVAAAPEKSRQMQQSMQSQAAMPASAAGAISKYQQQSKAGQSGTLLSGPTGVDPATFTLGKSTLLGA